MNKVATIILVIGAIAALGIIFIGGGGGEEAAVNNVKIVDGVQIVEITTKGGYRPKVSMAQAGLPTVLRFKTNGTFDCSIALRIPSQNVSSYLPQTGMTDFDIGSQSTGDTVSGMCSMGMYRFSVEFK